MGDGKRKETFFVSHEFNHLPFKVKELFKNAPEYSDPCFDGDKAQKENYPLIPCFIRA